MSGSLMPVKFRKGILEYREYLYINIQVEECGALCIYELSYQNLESCSSILFNPVKIEIVRISQKIYYCRNLFPFCVGLFLLR